MRHSIAFVFALFFSVPAAFAGITDESAAFYRNYEATRIDKPSKEHRVARGEHELHANEYAPMGQIKGAPIILMHGFPDSSHLYDRVAPLLAKDHRVISFDFLGWGKSDTPDDHRYDVSSLREDLQAVIEYFKLDTVILVVHDASGPPGIDWALANPDKVEGLVLLNTVYALSEKAVPPPVIRKLGTPGIFNRGLLAFGIRMSASQFQKGLADQVSDFFFDPIVRDSYVKLFVHQAPNIRPAFLGLTEVFFPELQSRIQRLPEIRELDIPTKIIFGAEDPFLNVAVADEFHALFPRSQLHKIGGAGHYVQLDRPGAVADAIEAVWP